MILVCRAAVPRAMLLPLREPDLGMSNATLLGVSC